MQHREHLHPKDGSQIQIATLAETVEVARACGKFLARCLDRNGNLKWDTGWFDNLITDEGAKLWEGWFTASSYSQVGPFMGLISSSSYTTGPQVGDTAAQINGTNAWKECLSASNPPFIGGGATRGTASGFAAASGTGAGNRVRALTSPVSFTIGGTGGTLKGCFLVLGAGAVNTLGSTAGTLFSAGLFSGGDKTVSPTDVVNVSWQISI